MSLNNANTVAVQAVQAVQNQEEAFNNYSNSYKNGIPSRGQSNHVADQRPSPFNPQNVDHYNNILPSITRIYNAITSTSTIIKAIADKTVSIADDIADKLRFGMKQCSFCRVSIINSPHRIRTHRSDECYYKNQYNLCDICGEYYVSSVLDHGLECPNEILICSECGDKVKRSEINKHDNDKKEEHNRIKDIKRIRLEAKLKIMKTVLILSFIVEEYYGNNLNSLPVNIQNKIKTLFGVNYQYHVIGNKSKYCTKSDLIRILNCGKYLLKHGTFHAVLLLFSGHGNENTLYLSDYNGTKNNSISRCVFESYFNQQESIGVLKLYVIEACLGSYASTPIYDFNKNNKNNNNFNNNSNNNNNNFAFAPVIIKPQSSHHRNENRIILYPNTAPYITLGTKPDGGYLLNALLYMFSENEKKYMNLSKMIDRIKASIQRNIIQMPDVNHNGTHDEILQLEVKSTVFNCDLVNTMFIKGQKDASNDSLIQYLIKKYSNKNIEFL